MASLQSCSLVNWESVNREKKLRISGLFSAQFKILQSSFAFIGDPNVVFIKPRCLYVATNAAWHSSSSKDLRWEKRILVIFSKMILCSDQGTFTVNTQICWGCLSSEAFPVKQVTCSSAITLIVVTTRLRRCACCSRSKSNFRKSSSYFEEITKASTWTRITGLHSQFWLIIAVLTLR